MIRRFLCHWLSHHDMELVYENLKSPWDFLRCKHCGLEAERHWHTRQIRFFDWVKS